MDRLLPWSSAGERWRPRDPSLNQTKSCLRGLQFLHQAVHAYSFSPPTAAFVSGPTVFPSGTLALVRSSRGVLPDSFTPPTSFGLIRAIPLAASAPFGNLDPLMARRWNVSPP